MRLTSYLASSTLFASLFAASACSGPAAPMEEPEPRGTGTHRLLVDVTGLRGQLTLASEQNTLVIGEGDGTPVEFAVLTSGAWFDIRIEAQPEGQRCTLVDAAGTIRRDHTIMATCSDLPPVTYRLSGVASDVVSSVVLADGDTMLTVAEDGDFEFEAEYLEGDAYHVTVLEHPEGRYCEIAGGEGVFTASDVTTITVTCHEANRPTLEELRIEDAYINSYALSLIASDSDGQYDYDVGYPEREISIVARATDPNHSVRIEGFASTSGVLDTTHETGLGAERIEIIVSNQLGQEERYPVVLWDATESRMAPWSTDTVSVVDTHGDLTVAGVQTDDGRGALYIHSRRVLPAYVLWDYETKIPGRWDEERLGSHVAVMDPYVVATASTADCYAKIFTFQRHEGHDWLRDRGFCAGGVSEIRLVDNGAAGIHLLVFDSGFSPEVRVYTRASNAWTLHQTVPVDDHATGFEATSGLAVVSQIDAQLTVVRYRHREDRWEITQRIESPCVEDCGFGRMVTITWDQPWLAEIAAASGDEVHIFDQRGGQFELNATLRSENPGHESWRSMDAGERRLVLGSDWSSAPGASNRGAVSVFARNADGDWTEEFIAPFDADGIRDFGRDGLAFDGQSLFVPSSLGLHIFDTRFAVPLP